MPTEPYLRDLADATAFERLVLTNVAPLAPRNAMTMTGSFDLRTNCAQYQVGVTETLGMTLDQAVERLGIRPLAFGAAWKVLDLLLEHAFEADGLAPANKKHWRWTIGEKVGHARSGSGHARPLSRDDEIWTRLLLAYAESEQVRHSLVHRTATIGGDGEIIGLDEQGAALQPVSVAEQDALCRVALLAFELLQAPVISIRDRNALLWQLDQLASITGQAASGAYEPPGSVATVSVKLDPPYRLDIGAVRERLQPPHAAAAEFNLLLEPTDRPERVLLFLEQAPDEVVALDFDNLPTWAERHASAAVDS